MKDFIMVPVENKTYRVVFDPEGIYVELSVKLTDSPSADPYWQFKLPYLDEKYTNPDINYDEFEKEATILVQKFDRLIHYGDN